MREVVIVGGSVAAVSAADTLRTEGFDGAITVVGDEPHTAYARPPLSKTALRPGEPPESIVLPGLDPSIEVRTDTRASGLDLTTRRLTVQHGHDTQDVSFDGLVLATGARARGLALPGQRGEHLLRSLDDAVALGEALAVADSVVVLGAGFLGMELASTARAMGVDVTVVDVVAPLQRQLGDTLAALVAAAAADAGVRIRVCPGGARLWGDPVGGVQLADGQVIAADVVISAIGDVPNVEWLAGSGLPHQGPLVTGPGGIVRPGLVAAGDMTAVRDESSGVIVRSPHWHSAIAQGRAAARTLLGLAPAGRVDVPYFWTEGFGLDVKITGSIPNDGAPVALDGSLDERRVLLQWRTDAGPVAAATVNYRMPLIKLKRLAAHLPASTTEVPA